MSQKIKKTKASNISIGLAGLGTVGAGVAQILHEQQKLLTQRSGVHLELKRVVVKSKAKARAFHLPKEILSSDLATLWQDPEIRIVVEVMGDVAASRKLVLEAIGHGKHVVTANKALIALHGPEIFARAQAQGVDVCFEAAVGGGIPVLRALREGLVANQIRSIHAIVNGTCNYILTEMSQKGSDFSETLQEAQRLGYAEADPGFDIDGIDASHKLAILIGIAYGVQVDLTQISVEGIRHVSALDLEFARRFGYAVKLLAIAKRQGGAIQARVQPTMIPQSSMLAAVQGVFNAIAIEGDFVGPTMLYGRGAGSEATASAVVGDIVEIARNLKQGVHTVVPPLGVESASIPQAKIEPIHRLEGGYYLRFQVLDRPGVLAEITGLLNRFGISISSFYQHGRESGREVPVVVLTHEAREEKLRAAIARIDGLKFVRQPTMVMRIEEI